MRVVDSTGSRVALTVFLAEVLEPTEKITGITARLGSKIDKVKLHLNFLGSLDPLTADVEQIYNSLNILMSLLSNAEVVQELSVKVDLPKLQSAIKRAHSAFYPFVSHAKTLGAVQPERPEASQTFGEKNHAEEEFYSQLNKLLDSVEGRDDAYQSKAPNNSAKRAAFRLLDYAVKLHFPKVFIGVALQLLLMVSEKGKVTRQVFCPFYEKEFSNLFDGRSKSFLLDSETRKDVGDKEIDELLRGGKFSDSGVSQLRFKTLWRIVNYDDSLDFEASSFCHYQNMGKKKGYASNRGKRAAARNLLYSVLLNGNEIQILRAMSDFLSHTLPDSKGEKLFRNFYFESCARHFGQFFDVVTREEKFFLQMKSPINIGDDVLAHWVLYASLHSLMIGERDVFKKKVAVGVTLEDFAAGCASKKALKPALLKLKLSLECGASLSQLLVVILDVVKHAPTVASKNDYDRVAKAVVEIHKSFNRERAQDKEDIQEDDPSKKAFESLYSGDLSNQIREVVKGSKKLRLPLANLRLKILHGSKQEIYLTLTQLLNQFGLEIEAKSKPLYLQLRSFFVSLSWDCHIHPIGNEGMRFIHVPLSWHYQKKGDDYILEPFEIKLPNNESIGPNFSGLLPKILNAILSEKGALGINLTNSVNGYSITITATKDLLATPLLEIQIDAKTFRMKSCNFEKIDADAQNTRSNFDKLEHKTQVWILRGIFDALKRTLNELNLYDPEIAKEVECIAQAADFPEALDSALQSENPAPLSAVQQSAQSRVSASEGRSRAESLKGVLGSLSAKLSRRNKPTTERSALSSSQSEISAPHPSRASTPQADDTAAQLAQSGIFAKRRNALDSVEDIEAALLQSNGSGSSLKSPSKTDTADLKPQRSVTYQPMPADLPPPPSLETPSSQAPVVESNPAAKADESSDEEEETSCSELGL